MIPPNHCTGSKGDKDSHCVIVTSQQISLRYPSLKYKQAVKTALTVTVTCSCARRTSECLVETENLSSSVIF